jgi:hypothetical protein
MEASRRPGMLEGLSRFLVQHERCGAGFDVAHPAGLGSGRVSITCRGCGARHEYATATIEIERELRIERTVPAARPQPSPPRIEPPAAPPARQPAAPPTAEPRAEPPAAPQPPARPIPPPPRPRPGALRALARSPGAALALFLVAAAALGFGVVRLINDDGGGGEPQGSQPSSEATAPPAGEPAPPAPQTPPPGAATGAGTPSPQAGQGPGQAQPATVLRTERFTVRVPGGWSERASVGGVLLRPRGGGRVNVQIYFQRAPGLSRAEMRRQTERFMRHEVPGARLFARPIVVAARPAEEITARGPGETAIAVNVLRGPYRYLLVRRIFAGAKPRSTEAADRVVSSFRPR